MGRSTPPRPSLPQDPDSGTQWDSTPHDYPEMEGPRLLTLTDRRLTMGNPSAEYSNNSTKIRSGWTNSSPNTLGSWRDVLSNGTKSDGKGWITSEPSSNLPLDQETAPRLATWGSAGVEPGTRSWGSDSSPRPQAGKEDPVSPPTTRLAPPEDPHLRVFHPSHPQLPSPSSPSSWSPNQPATQPPREGMLSRPQPLPTTGEEKGKTESSPAKVDPSNGNEGRPLNSSLTSPDQSDRQPAPSAMGKVLLALGNVRELSNPAAVLRPAPPHPLEGPTQAPLTASLRSLTPSEAQFFEDLEPGFGRMEDSVKQGIVEAYDQMSLECCQEDPRRARSEFWMAYLKTKTQTSKRNAVDDGEGAFTVFDCESPRTTSRLIDLHQPASCEPRVPKKTMSILARAAVVQADTGFDIVGYRCAAVYSHFIHRCGFDSISYGRRTLAVEAPFPITAESCRKAVKGGEIRVKELLVKVPLGQTRSFSIYTQGSLSNDFKCQGADFVSEGVSWHGALEEYVIKVSVTEVRGTVYANGGKVVFANGIHAAADKGETMDDSMGTLVWARDLLTDGGACGRSLNFIYQGNVSLVTDTGRDLATLTRGDVVLLDHEDKRRYAALVLQEETEVCGLAMFSTQITGVTVVLFNDAMLKKDSKLVQFLHHRGNSPSVSIQEQIAMAVAQLESNLAYIQVSKSISLEQRMSHLQGLICKNERSILSTRLAMIASRTGTYALLDTHGPGTLIIRTGSAAVIHQCHPRVATLRKPTNCTHEIPVSLADGSEDQYVDPLTLILQRVPSPTVCNGLNPVMWRIGRHWICSIPEHTRCNPPEQLTPTVDKEGPLEEDPAFGLGGGLYSSEQQAQRRIFIRMANSREAVVSEVTMNVINRMAQGGMPTLYSDNDFRELKDRIGSSIFPLYNELGDNLPYFYYGWFLVAAIVVGLGLAGRMYLTYRIFGCGWWMVASMFHLVFTLLALPLEVIRQLYRTARDGLHTRLHRPGQPRSGGPGEGPCRRSPDDSSDDDDNDDDPKPGRSIIRDPNATYYKESSWERMWDPRYRSQYLHRFPDGVMPYERDQLWAQGDPRVPVRGYPAPDDPSLRAPLVRPPPHPSLSASAPAVFLDNTQCCATPTLGGPALSPEEELERSLNALSRQVDALASRAYSRKRSAAPLATSPPTPGGSPLPSVPSAEGGTPPPRTFQVSPGPSQAVCSTFKPNPLSTGEPSAVSLPHRLTFNFPPPIRPVSLSLPAIGTGKTVTQL